MANPHVWKHIQHYHEDSGQRLEHAWQAEAWRDMDPNLVTPMVCLGHQDYYVYEIACLSSGELVMPHRWFTRRRSPTSEEIDLYCTAWKLSMDQPAQGYIIHEWEEIQFPATALRASFPHIVESFEIDRILYLFDH